VIAAYRVRADNSDLADAASAQILLTIPQPFANHNGGVLRFGPDGYLYIGMGDGGSANDPGNRAQDRFNLLGKILRLDVDGGNPYGIPATNPFASGGGGRPEIWAVGLRNPWKFAFDRATGDFFIGDVGQDRFEEVHRFDAAAGGGANLGWRVMEGVHCTGLPGLVPCFDPALSLPIIEYSHSAGCSVTGGTVYRGTAVPALAGRYVYGDFCSGRIWSAGLNRLGVWIPRDIGNTGIAISAFAEDEAGELYFADYARGEIRRFAAEPADRIDVIEYYNAALNHYFMTATPAEIHALDSGTLKGWARTSRSFSAFAQAASGTSPVCRYYLPPAFGDSHFYSASPVECDEVRAKFPGFVSEGASVLHIALPDTVTGVCATDTVPVYRVWNNRADANHRYTTDPAIRNAMVAQGGIAEGYGPDHVIMCAPQ
ncbi:MAG: PQQ-dependent sugar dehydrogenase, partial [Betaproteobacteria bacterium]|nr:PQQ-dependent sugar dehydrogenase [Betaproteobacteria bacterium]